MLWRSTFLAGPAMARTCVPRDWAVEFQRLSDRLASQKLAQAYDLLVAPAQLKEIPYEHEQTDVLNWAIVGGYSLCRGKRRRSDGDQAAIADGSQRPVRRFRRGMDSSLQADETLVRLSHRVVAAFCENAGFCAALKECGVLTNAATGCDRSVLLARNQASPN
jgi:hypothetical protein